MNPLTMIVYERGADFISISGAAKLWACPECTRLDLLPGDLEGNICMTCSTRTTLVWMLPVFMFTEVKGSVYEKRED